MWVLTIALALFTVNTPANVPFPTGSLVAAGQPEPANASGPINFKTMTVALCENTTAGSVRCHDEIKVICGDKEYILPKSEGQATCGSLKMNVPPIITAFAVYDKDWKDPRAS